MAEVSLHPEDVQAIITGIATHPEALASVAQLISHVNQGNSTVPPRQLHREEQPPQQSSQQQQPQEQQPLQQRQHQSSQHPTNSASSKSLRVGLALVIASPMVHLTVDATVTGLHGVAPHFPLLRHVVLRVIYLLGYNYFFSRLLRTTPYLDILLFGVTGGVWVFSDYRDWLSILCLEVEFFF